MASFRNVSRTGTTKPDIIRTMVGGAVFRIVAMRKSTDIHSDDERKNKTIAAVVAFDGAKFVFEIISSSGT